MICVIFCRLNIEREDREVLVTALALHTVTRQYLTLTG